MFKFNIGNFSISILNVQHINICIMYIINCVFHVIEKFFVIFILYVLAVYSFVKILGKITCLLNNKPINKSDCKGNFRKINEIYIDISTLYEQIFLKNV